MQLSLLKISDMSTNLSKINYLARGAAVTPQDDGALVVTGLDAAAIGDLAAAHGIAVHALIPRQASLEQAYLDLTGESVDYHGTPVTAEMSATR